MKLFNYSQLSPLLLAHFDHPQHVGCLDEKDTGVKTIFVNSPQGEEEIRFQIHLTDAGNIADVAWQAKGSSTTLACCSWFSEWVLGRSLLEVQRFEVQELIAALSLPQVRYNSAMLIEQIRLQLEYIHEL